LSPTVRRCTARALLGVGLYFTVRHRTAPMLSEATAEVLEKIARAPLESLGEGMRQALAALGVDAKSLGTAVGLGLYLAGVTLLTFGAWWTRPRPRLAYRRL
jgi:hypothetical protein